MTAVVVPVGVDGTPAEVQPAETAERLARQVDELTAVVERLGRQVLTVLGTVTSQLGEVHGELDELASVMESSGAGR